MPTGVRSGILPTIARNTRRITSRKEQASPTRRLAAWDSTPPDLCGAVGCCRWPTSWVDQWHTPWLVLLLLVVLLCAGSMFLAGRTAWIGSYMPGRAHLKDNSGTALLKTGRDHLVVYAFSYSDPEAFSNLNYFINEAVLDDTIADFIIIVQQGPTLQVSLGAATSLHLAACASCTCAFSLPLYCASGYTLARHAPHLGSWLRCGAFWQLRRPQQLLWCRRCH